ncbi:TorF family putative porin [Rhodocista pekingensis]|uniref:TorF family putative porin n=1 Tax=Rhodocista pekingensis TaxID=201185 RepID=A0ABW2KSZ9_9PROT
MRMSRLFATTAAAALLFGAAAAQAQDAPFTITGSAALTTDYVFRGISQTDEGVAAQAGLNLETNYGVFAGIWGSNVDFNDGDEASAELDYFIGYTNTIGNFGYTAQVLYYTYPGADSDLDYNYWEVGLNLEYTIGKFTPKASVYYSPEYFGNTGEAWYISGGLAAAVTDNLGVDVNVGLQTGEAWNDDVVDWSFGVTTSHFGLDFALRYHDTDQNADLSDERVVFTVSKSF